MNEKKIDQFFHKDVILRKIFLVFGLCFFGVDKKQLKKNNEKANVYYLFNRKFKIIRVNPKVNLSKYKNNLMIKTIALNICIKVNNKVIEIKIYRYYYDIIMN
ncbi:hypothetical protein F7018_09280 [Tenacibaculum aiptasiae]|uniref:Uncharacterized protein n=1 Tax=Tenacibaculum aiptasiae TaxID=426481 RepID=A0A7J5AL97_9FLAO|nr:hypothetical protein [Tenacibaculum aiptasiae]KAB1158361.1 hypothetical protein F7018_09280 [Tenacibaculum aiptasiae]